MKLFKKKENESPVIFLDVITATAEERPALREKVIAQLGIPDAEAYADRMFALLDACMPA